MSKSWDRKREKRWRVKGLKTQQRAQEVEEEMKRMAVVYHSVSSLFDDTCTIYQRIGGQYDLANHDREADTKESVSNRQGE